MMNNPSNVPTGRWAHLFSLFLPIKRPYRDVKKQQTLIGMPEKRCGYTVGLWRGECAVGLRNMLQSSLVVCKNELNSYQILIKKELKRDTVPLLSLFDPSFVRLLSLFIC